jgi:hypothetical protein
VVWGGWWWLVLGRADDCRSFFVFFVFLWFFVWLWSTMVFDSVFLVLFGKHLRLMDLLRCVGDLSTLWTRSGRDALSLCWLSSLDRPTDRPTERLDDWTTGQPGCHTPSISLLS